MTEFKHLDILLKYSQQADAKTSSVQLEGAETKILLDALNQSISTLAVGDRVAHATTYESENQHRNYHFWLIYTVSRLERGFSARGHPEIILEYVGDDEAEIFTSHYDGLSTDVVDFIPLSVVRGDLGLLRTLIQVILGFRAALSIAESTSSQPTTAQSTRGLIPSPGPSVSSTADTPIEQGESTVSR